MAIMFFFLLEALDDLFWQEATPHTKNDLFEVRATACDGGDGQEDTAVEWEGGAEVGKSEGPGALSHRAV